MINFLIMLFAVANYYLNIHFYLVLFLCFSLCRFRYNNQKFMFSVAVLGTIITFVIPFFMKGVIPFKIILGFQIFIGLWSIIFTIKRSLWKKDLIFFIMEPTILLMISAYFVQYYPLLGMQSNLLLWLSTYIGLQLLLIVLKLTAAYKLSEKAQSFLGRLKLLGLYLPHINPSFGLQDFSVSTGVSYFYQPTHLDNVMNELKFAENMIFAEMSGKVSEKEKLKKEREKLRGDDSGFSRFMKLLSN